MPRSTSIFNLKSQSKQHYPSLQLQDLPAEILITIISHLSPPQYVFIHHNCGFFAPSDKLMSAGGLAFALTCKRFYATHYRFHGALPFRKSSPGPTLLGYSTYCEKRYDVVAQWLGPGWIWCRGREKFVKASVGLWDWLSLGEEGRCKCEHCARMDAVGSIGNLERLKEKIVDVCYRLFVSMLRFVVLVLVARWIYDIKL